MDYFSVIWPIFAFTSYVTEIYMWFKEAVFSDLYRYIWLTPHYIFSFSVKPYLLPISSHIQCKRPNRRKPQPVVPVYEEMAGVRPTKGKATRCHTDIAKPEEANSSVGHLFSNENLYVNWFNKMYWLRSDSTEVSTFMVMPAPARPQNLSESSALKVVCQHEIGLFIFHPTFMLMVL